jgi:hypothetical protein
MWISGNSGNVRIGSLVLVYPSFTIVSCAWLLLGAFVKVVLPLSLPAILTVAGALIASVPVAIAYSVFLDRFITRITGGAVK